MPDPLHRAESFATPHSITWLELRHNRFNTQEIPTRNQKAENGPVDHSSRECHLSGFGRNDATALRSKQIHSAVSCSVGPVFEIKYPSHRSIGQGRTPIHVRWADAEQQGGEESEHAHALSVVRDARTAATRCHDCADIPTFSALCGPSGTLEAASHLG